MCVENRGLSANRIRAAAAARVSVIAVRTDDEGRAWRQHPATSVSAPQHGAHANRWAREVSTRRDLAPKDVGVLLSKTVTSATLDLLRGL